jgi:hypothetical protein
MVKEWYLFDENHFPKSKYINERILTSIEDDNY